MKKDRVSHTIVHAFLPRVVMHLMNKGLITDKMLEKPDELKQAIRKHLKTALRKITIQISLHEQFSNEAFRLWDEGKKYPAIVLFATAAEQVINTYYRHAFLASGLSHEEITAVIRSQSIDAKLSWLMKLATKTLFPQALGKRLRIVFEIRNSIVHYKAVPSPVDGEEGSYHAIEKRLKQIGRLSLRRDFGLLTKFLNGALLSHVPSLEVAHRIALKLLT